MDFIEPSKDAAKARNVKICRDIDNFYMKNFILYNEIGAHFKTPPTYFHEFILRYPEVPIKFLKKDRGVSFVNNKNKAIHRWVKYLEGFSQDFVYQMFNKFKVDENSVILDPFAGSGTVNVCAKLRGMESIGIEINPTIFKFLKAKLNWNIDISKFKNIVDSFDYDDSIKISPPRALKTERQFNDNILENILRIKQGIDKVKDIDIKNLLLLAFATILLPSSNLKRSPSIGYDKKKQKILYSELPIELFHKKIEEIIEDIKWAQNNNLTNKKSYIYNQDSKEFILEDYHKIDLVITSPPYLNSFDYVGNYKLEIGWIENIHSTSQFRELRDQMITCDNISRMFVDQYSKEDIIYNNDWIDYIKAAIEPRMLEREGIRRKDYPILIRKYCEDIYKVLKNIYKALKKDGTVIWVVGDSLIIDVYIPTDLLTLLIAKDIGYKLKKIEISRTRRSGVRRSFKLRESVIYFRK